jgi:hypothetical protein
VVLQAPKVVMGPGTGLGAAQLMWDEGRADYVVWPGKWQCVCVWGGGGGRGAQGGEECSTWTRAPPSVPGHPAGW